MLGAILAILSALTFALNNAAARRGVLTGTPGQGMAITVPIGVAGFLLVAVATGQIGRLAQFPPTAAAWMAAVGLTHFLVGRYCNYRANQEAGSNLTAPIVQLQVIVALVLAVIILREPCTVLQMIGGLLMLTGTLITQRQPARSRAAPVLPDAGLNGNRSLPPYGVEVPVFAPRHVAGYACLLRWRRSPMARRRSWRAPLWNILALQAGYWAA